MKKALIVTTVSGFLPQFELNNIKILQNMGYEIHYASNFDYPVYVYDANIFNKLSIKKHQVDFVRSPFDVVKNIKAYKQLKKIICDGKFDLIHSHTPMGGVLSRLITIREKNTLTIYTAHGFHFYKGASIKNWILYYPIEKILARYTNVLITINHEDYEITKKFKLKKGGSIHHINGIGINTSLIEESTSELDKLRQEFNIVHNEFVLVSVGELIERKNHKIILYALSKLNNKDIKYIICGSGRLEFKLKELTRDLGIEEQVIFTGYREDIMKILKIANCFIFPSLQEGLPVALLEAMVAGLPVICSRIRGNVDLIEHLVGGMLIEPNNVNEYIHAINMLYHDRNKCNEFALYNRIKIQNYDKTIVQLEMEKVYTLAENKYIKQRDF